MTVKVEVPTVGVALAEGAWRMDEAAYHADPCVQASLSSSIARVLLDATPAHAFWQHPRLNPVFEPEKSARNMTLGSACHQLLLGRGAEIVEIPADSYRTNIAKVARDSAVAEGKIPMLTKDREQALAIVFSARKALTDRGLSEMAGGEGDAEVTLAVQHESLSWLRARLDWWSTDRRLVVDYKTTSGLASAEEFGRKIAQMGYDVQAAFYLRTIERLDAALAGRLTFLFVVQEVEPPFALNVFELAEADLAVARRKVEAAVAIWDTCRRERKWPGYPASIETIALPNWHNFRWLERELNAGESPEWTLAGGER